MIAVKMPDGRRIAVEDEGDPNAYPVFLLHGMPGSRLGPKPQFNSPLGLSQVGEEIRLITYDRPGYGESTRQPGRRVAGAAADVEAVADHLELHRFAVVGRSGGAPHALACAALLGGRIDAVAAMVSLAPYNAPGLDWFDGMGEGNRRAFHDARHDPATLRDQLLDLATRVKADPGAVLPSIETDLAGPDLRVLANYGIMDALGAAYASAYQEGVWGHFDDMVALTDPDGWGFDLDKLYPPVLLWHGQRDAFSPPGHTEWLRTTLASAQVRVVLDDEAGHFTAIDQLHEVILWAAFHGQVRTSQLTDWHSRRPR